MVPDLVSVVIVCHNNWPDLELAIQSSLQQTYRPVEVIVVDNGSTDSTPSEVPKLFGNRVRYIHQANRGDGAGYNVGFRMSAGEFLQFLDGDDFLAPDKIGKQMDVLRRNPDADVVYGEVRGFQTPAGEAQWSDWDIGEQPDMLRFLITHSGGLARHVLLYRRRVLEAVGKLDEELFRSDAEHWFRIAGAGCRFEYCPEALCFYRRRPGQRSSNPLAWLRGDEALWEKVLGYITAEPYRQMILSKLALQRVRRAVSDPDFSVGEAFTKLCQARATDPAVVGRMAFAAGALLIFLPGTRWLIQAQWLRPLRRRISYILGLTPEPSPEHPPMIAASSPGYFR